jgi:cephalosporin hydroxylase
MAEAARESGSDAGKPVFTGAGAPPPAIPANRFRMPRDQWRFFPMLQSDEDHPKSWSFPAYLDNASVPWLAVLKELYASPLAFPASFSPEAGLLLHALVRNIRPRTIVEVGSFLGVSTIWMAAALEATATDPPHRPASAGAAIIHCFDDFGPVARALWRDAELNEPRLELVRGALRRARMEHHVVLHPGDSSVEIRKFREELRGKVEAWPGDSREHIGGVDFALIDGNHTVEGVLQDFWAIEPVLNTGGYVLLHDTFPEQCGGHEGPRRLIDQIKSVAQGMYEVCELYTAPLNYGIGLLRRVG